MKILLVITKADIGGAQMFVFHLARILKNRGHQVEVCAGEGDYLFEKLKKYNIPFYFLKSLKRNFSIFNSFLFLYEFYNLLKQNKYEIVHFNSSNTLIGALSVRILKKKPKSVFTVHGLSFLDKNYQIVWPVKLLIKSYVKIFIRFIDQNVFVSKVNFIEAKQAKIIKEGEIIYNGLDEKSMSFLSKEQARNFLAKKAEFNFDNCFIIGSIGRLAYQKNYEFLIDNFNLIQKRIENVKLMIIGGGPDYEKLQKKIQDLRLSQDLLLVGPIKDAYKYMKAFDLFTLSSRYEGLPISLIEACFAKIPILVSDVGGNREIVGSKQLFQLNNISDYLEKLLNIYNDRKKVDQNLINSNKFLLENMVSEYCRLYKKIA